jgi:hypothetical protein
MRLIDADKLIEHLKKIYDDCDIEDMLEFVRVSNFINNQPTAFDVDKVLKKLSERNREYQEKYREYQKEGCEMSEEIFYQKAKTMAEAYDIVEVGGIEC